MTADAGNSAAPHPDAGSNVRALDAELAAITADPAYPLASLSVLAIRGGRVVYEGQFGLRTIDSADPARNHRANAQSLYRIASISKLVTTLGVMRLIEAGTLELDRDAGDYLGFPLRNPHFPETPITLRMLLTHTSSMRDDSGYYWDKASGVTLSDVLLPGGARYGTGAMWAANARPGAYFSYANFSWGVVGTIMERATGERFDRLMRRLVVDPLHLHGGFEPAEFAAADLANVATLYRKRVDVDGKEVWNTAGPWVAQVDDYTHAAPVPRASADYVAGTNGTLFGPQGNCRLSAEGLATIAQMLMHRGRHRGRAFLQPATVAMMLSEQWHYDARGGIGADGTVGANGDNGFGSHRESMNAWGLGNQHFVDRSGVGVGDRLVEGGGFVAKGHTGDAWGLRGALLFDPAKKDALICLIGGHGFDPETNPGKYSAQFRHEEKILTAMHTRLFVDSAKTAVSRSLRPRRVPAR
ncbi:MAG: serine hydrolase domain-containing protein [Betaproteobacteria bacterium]